ncbi:MAG: ribosome maturation factor RimP [Ekhidna sp.]|nr:ribosome maturation factor RimP [Ekhidna sp.]
MYGNLEEEKTKELIKSVLKNHKDLFLVDVKIKGAFGNRKLLVFVDADADLTIDRCGKLNREIGNKLEETDLIDGKYTLEVSSPGLDFPLEKIRQYKKNIGRQLIVNLKNGQKLEGKLKKISEEYITLAVKEEIKNISRNEVEKSIIKVLFK